MSLLYAVVWCRVVLPSHNIDTSATLFITKHCKLRLIESTTFCNESYNHTRVSQHTVSSTFSLLTMRPTPRLFAQAARAPSMLQRFAKSPMSPPIEAYPLFVLITGMVSLQLTRSLLSLHPPPRAPGPGSRWRTNLAKTQKHIIQCSCRILCYQRLSCPRN